MANNSVWYYVLQDTPQGPVSAKGIRDLAERGIIVRETPVWREGIPNWVAAGRVRGIRFPRAMAPVVEETTNSQDASASRRSRNQIMLWVAAIIVGVGTIIGLISTYALVLLLGITTVLLLLTLPLILQRLASRQQGPEMHDALIDAWQLTPRTRRASPASHTGPPAWPRRGSA